MIGRKVYAAEINGTLGDRTQSTACRTFSTSQYAARLAFSENLLLAADLATAARIE
jgi:hypothetical protein